MDDKAYGEVPETSIQAKIADISTHLDDLYEQIVRGLKMPFKND